MGECIGQQRGHQIQDSDNDWSVCLMISYQPLDLQPSSHWVQGKQEGIHITQIGLRILNIIYKGWTACTQTSKFSRSTCTILYMYTCTCMYMCIYMYMHVLGLTFWKRRRQCTESSFRQSGESRCFPWAWCHRSHRERRTCTGYTPRCSTSWAPAWTCVGEGSSGARKKRI